MDINTARTSAYQPSGQGMSGGAGWGAIAQFGTDLMNVGHSAIQNRKAREFAEHVAKNQIRWRVADMKAAGINPIHAVQGGLGGGGGGGAGMIGGAARGGYSAASLAEQQRRNAAKENEILQQKLEQEWNRTAASDHLPGQAAADVRLTNARAALAHAGVPRAELQERLMREGITKGEEYLKDAHKWLKSKGWFQ